MYSICAAYSIFGDMPMIKYKNRVMDVDIVIVKPSFGNLSVARSSQVKQRSKHSYVSAGKSLTC